MIDNSELKRLVKEARNVGAIIRTKHDADDCIIGVSIGKVPGGEYRRLGEPGTGWIPPIAAAERLREILDKHFAGHLKRATATVATWPEWKQKLLG